jgi:hypothetical protein
VVAEGVVGKPAAGVVGFSGANAAEVLVSGDVEAGENTGDVGQVRRHLVDGSAGGDDPHVSLQSASGRCRLVCFAHCRFV